MRHNKIRYFMIALSVWTLTCFFASTGMASFLSVRTNYSVLTPDGDGVKDYTNISFTIPSAGTVKIKISQVLSKERVDTAEKQYILVRNLPHSGGKYYNQAGTYTVKWNGTNDAGQVVQNGIYRVQIIFIPEKGKQLVDSISIRVEVIPIFTDLKFLPDPFTPGKEKATIEYRLTKKALVRVRITGLSGIIFTRNWKMESPDKFFVDWNGKDQRTGRVAAPGEYKVHLEARIGDGEPVAMSTNFHITRYLAVEAISATPRTFDPKDKGGNFSTRIAFMVDNPNVDYTVIIQDQSGNTVWNKNFSSDYLRARGFPSRRKEFSWGGLRDITLTGSYVLKRTEVTKEGEELIEKTVAETVNFQPIIIGNLIYTNNGKLDRGNVLQQLKKDKLLYQKGDQYEYRGAWWTIADVKFDKKVINYLPNGVYTIRIRVKDPGSQKVSAEFGTEVTIHSQIKFKLCVRDITPGDEQPEYQKQDASRLDTKKPSLISSRSNESILNKTLLDQYQTLIDQYQVSWCQDEEKIEGYKTNKISNFAIKGGTLKKGLKNDVKIFDPASLKWITAEKISPYLDFRDDRIRIWFRVTKDADVRAQIRSSKGGVIRRLTDKKAHLASDISHSFFEWDGFDDEGQIVPNGFYIIDISATDTDPAAPKTLTTSPVISAEDIRRLTLIDRKNSSLLPQPKIEGSTQNIVELFAFKPVSSFNEISGYDNLGGSGLNELLEKSVSSTRQEQRDQEGNFSIIFNNYDGDEFFLEYFYTAFTEKKVSENESYYQITPVGKIAVKRSFDAGGDKQQCKIDGEWKEDLKPGIYDLWVFAMKPGACRGSTYGYNRYSRDPDINWGRIEDLVECFQSESMTVKKIKVRALGHLTEAGAHLKKVLAEGFSTMAAKAGASR